MIKLNPWIYAIKAALYYVIIISAIITVSTFDTSMWYSVNEWDGAGRLFYIIGIFLVMFFGYQLNRND